MGKRSSVPFAVKGKPCAQARNPSSDFNIYDPPGYLGIGVRV